MSFETLHQTREFRAGHGGRGRERIVKPKSTPSSASPVSRYVSQLTPEQRVALLGACNATLEMLDHQYGRDRKYAVPAPQPRAPLPMPPRAQHSTLPRYPAPEDPGAGDGGDAGYYGGGTEGGQAEPQTRPTGRGQQGQGSTRAGDAGAGSEPVAPPRDPAVQPVDTSKQPQPVYPDGPPPVPASSKEAGLYSSIRRAEGTTDDKAQAAGFASGYDVPLGYGKYGRPSKPLTEMTLREAHEFGNQVRKHPDNPYNSSALGAFQIVGTTMKEYMDDAGLTWDDKFTPENQQKLAAVIAKEQGLGAWEGFKHHPLHRRQAAEAMRTGDMAPGGGGGTYGGGGATAEIPPITVTQPAQPLPTGGAGVGAGGRVIQQQQQVAATRKGALAPHLEAQLADASARTGLDVIVFSGGQRMPGARGHTGSHRHDYGNSADLQLRDRATGRLLNMNDPHDAARMAEFVEAATAAGATGVGGHPTRYMGATKLHVGGGSPATWGGSGKTAGTPAPQWLKAAHARGMQHQAKGTRPAPTAKSVPTSTAKHTPSVAAHNARLTGAPAQSSDVAAHNAKMTGLKE